jgi:aminopeptidase 2
MDEVHRPFESGASDWHPPSQGYYLSTYGAPVDGKYRHFALTQLECASARQVYPCWDEPSMKASFAFTMITVDGLKCLSCMPETTSPTEAQSRLAQHFEEEGWQTVHFETTPPVSNTPSKRSAHW